jgi:hypothetical protein
MRGTSQCRHRRRPATPVLAFRPTPPLTSAAPPWRRIQASSSERGRLVGALHPTTTPMAPPQLPHQRHRGCQDLHPRALHLPRHPRPHHSHKSSVMWRLRTTGRGSGAARGTQPRWASPLATDGRWRPDAGRRPAHKGAARTRNKGERRRWRTRSTRRRRRHQAAAAHTAHQGAAALLPKGRQRRFLVEGGQGLNPNRPLPAFFLIRARPNRPTGQNGLDRATTSRVNRPSRATYRRPKPISPIISSAKSQ